MADRRSELIHSAIMDKVTGGIAIFTSDDILTVAGITNEEIEKVALQLQNSVDTLTFQSTPPPKP